MSEGTLVEILVVVIDGGDGLMPGFYRATAWFDGKPVAEGWARTRARARAYALRLATDAMIRESVAEEGWVPDVQ